jgi:hypothetical protein
LPAASTHSSAVSDTVDTLILDLLEWMGPDPRPYAEVLEAWRTSFPPSRVGGRQRSRLRRASSCAGTRSARLGVRGRRRAPTQAPRIVAALTLPTTGTHLPPPPKESVQVGSVTSRRTTFDRDRGPRACCRLALERARRRNRPSLAKLVHSGHRGFLSSGLPPVQSASRPRSRRHLLPGDNATSPQPGRPLRRYAGATPAGSPCRVAMVTT